MNEKELRVGSFVKIKSLKTIKKEMRNDFYHYCGFISDMFRFCGKTAKIVKSKRIKIDNKYVYNIDLDRCCFSWSLDMFENSWSKVMENE